MLAPLSLPTGRKQRCARTFPLAELHAAWRRVPVAFGLQTWGADKVRHKESKSRAAEKKKYHVISVYETVHSYSSLS